MSREFHSSIMAPQGIWWQPAEKQEKRWIIISFIWCMILFAMMPLWHIKGGQNPTGIRGKVDPIEYAKRTAVVPEFVTVQEFTAIVAFPAVKTAGKCTN